MSFTKEIAVFWCPHRQQCGAAELTLPVVIMFTRRVEPLDLHEAHLIKTSSLCQLPRHTDDSSGPVGVEAQGTCRCKPGHVAPAIHSDPLKLCIICEPKS